MYEAVWEEVYLPGDNTLNAQLSNLRKKIAQLDPNEDYIETVGAWEFAWKETSNVGLVLVLVVLVLLGTGLCSLAFCLKRFAGADSTEAPNGSGVRLTSRVSKRIGRLDQAGQWSLWSDRADQSDCLSREKTLDMAISNIAHDIRTPLTIASGYTQQIIKGGTQEEEKLKKIASNLQVVSKRLESLLEYRRLMEGSHPASAFRRQS